MKEKCEKCNSQESNRYMEGELSGISECSHVYAMHNIRQCVAMVFLYESLSKIYCKM